MALHGNLYSVVILNNQTKSIKAPLSIGPKDQILSLVAGPQRNRSIEVHQNVRQSPTNTKSVLKIEPTASLIHTGSTPRPTPGRRIRLGKHRIRAPRRRYKIHIPRIGRPQCKIGKISNQEFKPSGSSTIWIFHSRPQ